MPNEVREGVGRRQSDEECRRHEGRMDELESDISKQSGWLKASAGLVTVVSVAVSILCSIIISKLGTIESLLTDSKVVLMQHSEQIKTLQGDLKEVQDRHRYEDQSGHMQGGVK